MLKARPLRLEARPLMLEARPLMLDISLLHLKNQHPYQELQERHLQGRL